MADMEANTVMATQAQELVDASAGDVARGVGTGQHANVEAGTNCNASSFGSSDNNSFSQTGAAPTVTLGVDAKHLSDALDAMSKRIMTESQRLQAKEAAADEKLASALAVAAGCAVSQSQVAAEKARVEQLAADLQAEAERFRREREALEVVVSDARSRHQEAEEREAAYRRRCEDAEGRYSGVEAAARAATARVAELEEALAKETTDRQSMADKLQETSVLLDGETKAKESAESRARKAEDTSAQAEAAVAILRSEVSRLETAVLELDLKLRDAYRNAEAERNDAASARSSLEAELLKSRASAAGFKSRCDELEVSLASSTAECKSKAGELKEAKKQQERMKSAWEKDKKKLDLIKSLTSTLSDMHSAPVDAALPPSPSPMLMTPGAGAGASSTSPASSSPAQSPRGHMHSPTSAVSSPAAAPVVTATAASNGVISGGNDEMAVEAHSSDGASLQGADGASAEAGGAAVVPTAASPPRLQHGAATTAANSGSSSKKLATRSSITAAFQPSSPSAGPDEPATTGGDASASVDVGAGGDASGVDGSAPALQEAVSHVITTLVPSASGTKRKRSLSADEVGEGEGGSTNAAAPRVGEASSDDDAAQPRAAKTIALGIDAADEDNAGKCWVGDIAERHESEAAAEESASSSAEQAQGADGGNGSSANGLAQGEAAGDEVAGAVMQDQQDRQPDEVVMSSESAAPSSSSSMLPAAALAAQQSSVQAADGGGGGSIMFEDAQTQEDGISPVPASLAAAQLSAAVAVTGDAAVAVPAAGGAAADEGGVIEEPCLDPHHPIDDHAVAEGRMAVDEGAVPNEVAADLAVAVAASQQQQSHINAFEPAVFSGSASALPAPVGPPPADLELATAATAAAASSASGPDGDVVMHQQHHQQHHQQQREEQKGPDAVAPLSLPRASSSPAKPVPSAVQAPASTAPAAAPSPLPPQGSLPSSSTASASTAPKVKHTVATEEPHRPSPNIIPVAAAAAIAVGPQSSAVDAEAHLVRLPKDFMASIAAIAASSSSTKGAAGVQKTIRDIKNSYSIDAANGEVGIALSSGVHKDLGKGGNSVGRNKENGMVDPKVSRKQVFIFLPEPSASTAAVQSLPRGHTGIEDSPSSTTCNASALSIVSEPSSKDKPWFANLGVNPIYVLRHNAATDSWRREFQAVDGDPNQPQAPPPAPGKASGPAPIPVVPKAGHELRHGDIIVFLLVQTGGGAGDPVSPVGDADGAAFLTEPKEGYAWMYRERAVVAQLQKRQQQRSAGATAVSTPSPADRSTGAGVVTSKHGAGAGVARGNDDSGSGGAKSSHPASSAVPRSAAREAASQGSASGRGRPAAAASSAPAPSAMARDAYGGNSQQQHRPSARSGSGARNGSRSGSVTSSSGSQSGAVIELD